MRAEPRSTGRDLLVRSWSERGALRAVLAPLAWAYRGGVAMRRVAYRLGLRRAVSVGVPVVSIGNLTVGGTGKTPTALWLAERLRGDGRVVGIVSRGYGGRLGRRTVLVGHDGRPLGDVDEVGDEATLLAERFAGPVVCGADRVAAARLAVSKHQVDAIVLDDGFQHWRLKRDVDIVLVDGRMGFGNDALLPAGPLREPLSALRRADAIVVTKVDAPGEIGHALQRCAPGVPIFSAELTPDCIVHAEEGALRTRPLGDLVGRAVVIVSAVAQPESFYRLLAQLEARPVEVLEYPDHHPFTQTDWQRINHAARRAELVVCTEKDLVKLRRFPFARGGLAALRVRFAPAPGEEAELYALIQRRLDQAVGAYARNA